MVAALDGHLEVVERLIAARARVKAVREVTPRTRINNAPPRLFAQLRSLSHQRSAAACSPALRECCAIAAWLLVQCSGLRLLGPPGCFCSGAWRAQVLHGGKLHTYLPLSCPPAPDSPCRTESPPSTSLRRMATLT
jgi:hypothetical protein